MHDFTIEGPLTPALSPSEGEREEAAVPGDGRTPGSFGGGLLVADVLLRSGLCRKH